MEAAQPPSKRRKLDKDDKNADYYDDVENDIADDVEIDKLNKDDQLLNELKKGTHSECEKFDEVF